MASKRSARRNRWLLAGFVLVAVIGLMSFLNLETYSVYFYTPSEAHTQAGTLTARPIRVGGMVQAGSVQWRAENLALEFVLTDLKGTDIQVSHKGTPPDLFKENSGVVVEGRIDAAGKTIISHQLLVKHDERYQVPGDSTHPDMHLIQSSILQGEKKSL